MTVFSSSDTSLRGTSGRDPSGQGAAGPYLRTTVMSPQRVCDVVLPTDQIVADLMPGLLDLMGISTATAPKTSGYVLHTPIGHVIDPERPLAGAMLHDGVVLRFVAEQEAPAEAVTSDLLDLLESEPPRARWNAAATTWTLACAGVSALSLGAGLWVVMGEGAAWPRLAAVAIFGLALSAVSATVGWAAVAWVSGAAAVVAAGVGVGLGAPTIPLAGAWGCAVVLCAIAVTGWCHKSWRSTLTAALTWMFLVGMAGLSWSLKPDPVLTCAIVATSSSVTVGMLPRAALGLTGVLGTDAQVASGAVVSRRDARSVVDQAHHALAGAVATCALGYAVSGVALAVMADLNLWALALLAATVLSWLARIRHFPLVPQRLAMGAAVLAVAGGLAAGVVVAEAEMTGWVAGTCGVTGAGVLAIGWLRLSSVAAAVIRRWVQRIETVAVVVTVPCLIGLLGVYADLLETF